MIWKNAFKYPVLVVGIILFGLYISDPKTREYWANKQSRFIPSTCDAIVDRSAKKADSSWSFDCPGTKQLVIKIPYEEMPGDKFPETRIKMYKHLANSLVKLSQFTNPEAMEHLLVLKMIIESDRLKILAQTDGDAVVEFKQKKTQEEISEHLKLTVKIKEFR